MAAALWHGGISFGGVISFIFADLIAFPLVLIYRKYYGTKLTIRLFAVFYLVMAAAGALVEGLFAVTGLIPSTRPKEIVATSFQWNYTTFLNIVFIGAFAVLYWLHRNRERLGGGVGYAIDPVCGMQVETANAPAHSQIGGAEFWFCSDGCMERFEASPDRFAAAQPTVPGEAVATPETNGPPIDPVCGMSVEPSGEAPHRVLNGETFYFCCKGCAVAFESDPDQYLAGKVEPRP